MNDSSDEKKRGDVGFGRPPAEHRFKKGQSGNRKGRPRNLRRLLAPRQVRRDILSITEAPITIQTSDGEITVPTFVAVLMVAKRKALQGHGPSIRLLMDRHNQAIAAHWDIETGVKLGASTLEEEVRNRERHQDEDEIRKRVKRRKRRS